MIRLLIDIFRVNSWEYEAFSVLLKCFITGKIVKFMNSSFGNRCILGVICAKFQKKRRACILGRWEREGMCQSLLPTLFQASDLWKTQP